MLLRPLRRAPMMLGGVGFQVGLDEARRKQREASRQTVPQSPGGQARPDRAAQGLEGALETAFSRRRSSRWRNARCWTDEHTMPLGPVQLLVVGFDRPDFNGAVLAELERLRERRRPRHRPARRHKDADGVVQRLHRSDLTAGETGAAVGALIGLDATGVDAGGGHLPPARSLVSGRGNPERLRRRDRARRAPLGDRHADAIRAAGGVAVAEAWVHPADLVAAGIT